VKRSNKERRSEREASRWLFWRRAEVAEGESHSPGAPGEPPSPSADNQRDEAPRSRVMTVPPARPRRVLSRAVRRASQPPPPAEPPAPPAREWNLWELERRAREQAGNAPRDEEWSALFTNLRTFANADGVLPKEFDGLVRESFGRLIEAA
jgi:hypothetical protein